jgi:hypothetical protein
MKSNPDGEYISTSNIGLYLGVAVSVKILSKMVEPAIITNTGTYWKRTDIPTICRALTAHLEKTAKNFEQKEAEKNAR